MNRGEVWIVDLTPSYGNEMRDPHPAVIINDDSIRELNLRVIVPITSWKNRFKGKSVLIKINPNPQNGLSNKSAVNVLQIRSVDAKRFKTRLGKVTDIQMERIEEGICIILKLPFGL
jgi:mRNA interferase MazF